MEREEILKELEQILNSNISDAEKRETLLQYHESDIADLLEELEPEERDELYRILGNDNIADVWTHAENIEELVGDIEPEKAAWGAWWGTKKRNRFFDGRGS